VGKRKGKAIFVGKGKSPLAKGIREGHNREREHKSGKVHTSPERKLTNLGNSSSRRRVAGGRSSILYSFDGKLPPFPLDLEAETQRTFFELFDLAGFVEGGTKKSKEIEKVRREESSKPLQIQGGKPGGGSRRERGFSFDVGQKISRGETTVTKGIR